MVWPAMERVSYWNPQRSEVWGDPAKVEEICVFEFIFVTPFCKLFPHLAIPEILGNCKKQFCSSTFTLVPKLIVSRVEVVVVIVGVAAWVRPSCA